MSDLLCTFRIQDKLFGVDVSQVQEVLRAQPLTLIPQAPLSFAGLMNLRGQIVLVIEPSGILCGTIQESQRPPMFVVLRSPDGPLALRVDEVGEVIPVDSGFAEPLPAKAGGAIQSAYKLPKEILLRLNPEVFYQINTNPQGELS